LKWSLIQKVSGILLADSSDIVLQHNMDIIKVECDPDIEAHAVSLCGEGMKQNIKEELMDGPVTFSMQNSEVQIVIQLDIRLASLEKWVGGWGKEDAGRHRVLGWRVLFIMKLFRVLERPISPTYHS
jgi:hypothetical protein